MNSRRARLPLLVFFISMAAVAGAATRPLTLPELETIQVTTPVLKVVVGEPRFVLNVQVNYEGEGWKTVYSGGAGDPDGYLILLEGYPDKVRAGLTGHFAGPLAIDGISLLKPDGSELAGTRATPVNSASNAENVLAFDGKCASISHSADPPEQRDRFDGVEVVFEYEGGKPTAEPIPMAGSEPPRSSSTTPEALSSSPPRNRGRSLVTRSLSGSEGLKGLSISSKVAPSQRTSTSKPMMPDGSSRTSWAVTSAKKVWPSYTVLLAIGAPGAPLSSS